jgi:hypothetical protein
MAVIRAPVFKGLDLEWGVHCLGCKRSYEGDHLDMGYAAMMFDPDKSREHVKKHAHDQGSYDNDSFYPNLFDMNSFPALPFGIIPFSDDSTDEESN